MERMAFLLPDMRGGGAERVALKLLQEFVARGYAVDLLLSEEGGELLPLLPPEVRVIDLRAPRIRYNLRPLIRYLRRHRPAALQVSMWPLTIIGIIARMIARVPTRVVVSDHAVLSRQYESRPRSLKALAFTVRRFYPLAAGRVVVSAGAAEDLAALSGIDRTSLTVIGNPISPPAEAGPDPRAEQLWRPGHARIISVGALKEEKNQALLIAAFAALRKNRPATLTILGEGALRGQLEAQVAQAGVAGEVNLPGYVADPFPYLRSADLFVLSSDHEGFGNVLVEALYAGLRVVSTDCPGGPRDILEGGIHGRLVPCGDARALAEAMAAALAEPADPERHRARGLQLSGPHVIDKYLDLMLGR